MFLRNDHSLSLLDFFRIRERTAEYCLSDEGGALLRASFPIADAIALGRFKKDLVAIRDHLASNEFPGFGFPQIEGALKRLGVAGMTLELDELLALGLWTREFDHFVAQLSKIKVPFSGAMEGRSSRPSTEGSREQSLETEAAIFSEAAFEPAILAESWARHGLSELIAAAPKLQYVYKIIFEIVNPEGELRDLPEIRRIREAIARAKQGSFIDRGFIPERSRPALGPSVG